MMLRQSALALLCALALSSAAHAITAGQPAPGFTGTDLKGKPVHLSDFKGKYVVLEWTSPDCPFVQRHYNAKNIPTLQKDWAGRGVVWLSIDSTSTPSGDVKLVAKLDKWMQAHEAVPKDVLIDADSAIAKLYGAKTTPEMFVINPQGVVIYAGAIDDDPGARPEDTWKAKNYVRAALAAAMSGDLVSPANTTPYGCAIKY